MYDFILILINGKFGQVCVIIRTLDGMNLIIKFKLYLNINGI